MLCVAGIGSMVFNRAIKTIHERNLLLAVTIQMEPVFERWKYHFSSHHVMSCDGKPKLPQNYHPPSHITIQRIDFENLADVLELDQKVSSLDRSHTFRSFLQSKNTICGLCATQNGKFEGFAFLRKASADALRLSAFYADSVEVAEALMFELVKKHITEGCELLCWFSIVNIDRCRRLYRRFGLDDPESQFRLMYSKEDAKVPWFKVYAIYEHYAYLV